MSPAAAQTITLAGAFFAPANVFFASGGPFAPSGVADISFDTCGGPPPPPPT